MKYSKVINTLFAGGCWPGLSVTDAWSKKLSFCPLLNEYRDVILFVCEVFPIAALTNEVGNCAAAEVPAVSASITFVTCITSETPRDDVPVIGA